MGYTTASDVRHDNNAGDWRLIHRMLTGEDATKELVRGGFEAQRAFDQRKKIADWRPYTRDLISRLVGRLFLRTDEVERDVTVSDEYLASVGPDGHRRYSHAR